MHATEHHRADRLLLGQTRVLEMIARGSPLAETLDAIVRLIEELAPGMLGSILLLDQTGRLRHGAAPSLPAAYNRAVDGLVVGPVAGSCGTAAHRKEPVVVTDIETDPLWAEYRDLGLRHGLRACWSTPILTRDGRVLGTFAMYYREPRAPSAAEAELIAVATHLAGIAIERARDEEGLRLRERQLRDAQQIARLGSWEWDIRHDVVSWSDEVYRIFELTPERFGATFEAYLERVHPEERSYVRRVVERARRDHGPFTLEHRITRPGGGVRVLHCRGEVATDGNGHAIRMSGIVQDITERKEIEARLRHSEAKLRSFAAHQEEVREEERTRIAREIHDALGQSLTALKLELATLREMAARGEPGVDGHLRDLAGLVDAMVKSVRRISTELRPPVLDELGLPAAVEWLARDFTKRTGLTCRVTVNLADAALVPEVTTGLFRILQEALTNVVRHADARTVEISLQRQDGVAHLEVADDGRGITEAEATGAGALGMLGMRERALLLGGTLEVIGIPGRGTTLRAWIPIR